MSGVPREITPPPDPPPCYSRRPFPPYRHVPGLHPHPVAHPDGHSYSPAGTHPEAGPLMPPERWRECDDYLYGADLYNYGYWWEAHEAWEGLWQQTDKRQRQGRFLQGLIQVSAAQLKRHMEQRDGVDRLLARAKEHLHSAERGMLPGQRYMGLDLRAFIGAVDGWFDGKTTVFPMLVLDDGSGHLASGLRSSQS